MSRLSLRVLLVLLWLLAADAAVAQRNLGPNPVIGGVPVSCFGATTIVAPVNDIAKALPGQIILNPVLFNYPPVIQVFVYAHECAHQVVGGNEQAADCWAVRVMRNQGLLPPQYTSAIARMFANSPGDWTHAPGPQRVQQMAYCYNTP